MNELANLELLAILARERQEEMLCEAKTRAMLKALNPRPAWFLLAVIIAIIAAAAVMAWAVL
jgi:hypothetical protein